MGGVGGAAVGGSGGGANPDPESESAPLSAEAVRGLVFEQDVSPGARLALDETPPGALVEHGGQPLRLALVQEEELRETPMRTEPAERKTVLCAERQKNPRVGNGIGQPARHDADVARALDGPSP